MQAVCSTSAALKPATVQTRRSGARSSRAAMPVTCNMEQAKKAVAVAAAALPTLAAMPALALVDERLAGEGTSKIFGIASGAEGWAIFLTFGVIWAIYATTAKTLGGAKDEDSGLSL